MARGSKRFSSSIVALSGGGATIEIDADSFLRHWFAGVEYYTDAAGTPGTPTAGTETYQVKTAQKENDYQNFTGNAINSGDVQQVSWEAPTRKIKVVLAGVSGGSVTHVRLRAGGTVS